MKRILLTIISIASLGYCQAQQPDYGKELIEAINVTSDGRRKEMIQTIFSDNALLNPGIDPIMDMINRWHSQYSPMDFHHTDINEFKKPSGSVYVMHVYARKKGEVMYTDFQIYLDPNPPHKIEKPVFIAEVAEPVNLPNGSIDQPETLNWLNKYAEKLRTENDLYGSFLIVKGDQVLFEKQFGYEDVDKKIPITRKTIFGIASGGKMFTAISIAQLAELRKLNYHDPVTKYLDGFSDKAKASKITIHHLLSHTSGIAEYWSGQNNTAVFSATNTSDHLKIVYEAGFDFEAGQQYQYCNSNFIVLGAIIEKVTGTSYYDYVRKNIFERAGMTASGYFDHGKDGVATAQARDSKTNGWTGGRLGKRGSSAGGAHTTLADMQSFSKALKKNILIQLETLVNMTSTKNAGLDVTENYGYGFILSQLGGEPAYGHGGTSNGTNFEFRYFTRQDVTLIMFCNQNNGAYDDLKKNMIKLISGHR